LLDTDGLSQISTAADLYWWFQIQDRDRV